MIDSAEARALSKAILEVLASEHSPGDFELEGQHYRVCRHSDTGVQVVPLLDGIPGSAVALVYDFSRDAYPADLPFVRADKLVVIQSAVGESRHITWMGIDDPEAAKDGLVEDLCYRGWTSIPTQIPLVARMRRNGTTLFLFAQMPGVAETLVLMEIPKTRSD